MLGGAPWPKSPLAPPELPRSAASLSRYSRVMTLRELLRSTAPVVRTLATRLVARIRVGADPRCCAPGTLVFLPRGAVRLGCGIAALVEVAGADAAEPAATAALPSDLLEAVLSAGLGSGTADEFAGGEERIAALATWARGLKRERAFAALIADDALRATVADAARSLRDFAATQEDLLRERAESLREEDVETFTGRLLRVRDVAWHVEEEALSQLADVTALAGDSASPKLAAELRRIAAVLRCVDRIEIRGRDSAGLAVQVVLGAAPALEEFRAAVDAAGLTGELDGRLGTDDLPPLAIALEGGDSGGAGAGAGADARPATATFVYKVAAEVGRLGDNVAELRRQIGGDALLRLAVTRPDARTVLLGHTRWASSGVISLPNCHPVDNESLTSDGAADASVRHRSARIYVVMNGDVDNHLELRERYERETGRTLPERVTTDTKTVALEIERELVAGADIEEAFRLACGRFDGSCAIGMISDLAPGRLFLSLHGSGQSLYVGASSEGFFASSEVYGLVEETGDYLKLDGESERVEGDPQTRGQMVVVGTAGPTGAEGLRRRCLDGEPLPLGDDEIRRAEITTRDVDRAGFSHYFRKEITQSRASVARTLLGRVQTANETHTLADTVVSDEIRARIDSGLRRIYVVGQGTAAVAGSGIAAYLALLLSTSAVRVIAIPATELSGFHLSDDMTDTLIIAVTQSGSTADTNRAIDLARRRGAGVAAVVNRRNSDVTYRVDGVVYTSDGRDVEMSVASTKAFYSQIVAGALLSLGIAREIGVIGADGIAERLRELVALPGVMQRVLDDESAIEEAAARLGPTRQHWAVVGSGPNRVAAHEVRIKLSELCYKSIALDTVEDKKHIDLSSEPLIIVMAAGNPEPVLNDVVKDVAIFKAHKALPIVVAGESETRFDPYASAVLKVPDAPPLTSMILCALVGHLLGYHAARAIDDNARFIAGVRAAVAAAMGDDEAYEELAETLEPLRAEYLDRLHGDRFTSALSPLTAVRVGQFMDHLTGVSVLGTGDLARLGVDDGSDAGSESGTDILAGFVNELGEALDQCARPVDAIKHQAKIVTVGTSRPEEGLPPVVGGPLSEASVDLESVAPIDRVLLRRLAPALAEVEGFTRYAVSELRSDGSPGSAAQIRVTARGGVALGLSSRVEAGGPLAGTKRQVVVDRHAFLGVGRGDGRRIAIMPVLGRDRHVSGLVLLHLRFVEDMPIDGKLRLLGHELDRLRDLVAEGNRTFRPDMLAPIAPEQLVLEDAEDLAEILLAAE